MPRGLRARDVQGARGVLVPPRLDGGGLQRVRPAARLPKRLLREAPRVPLPPGLRGPGTGNERTPLLCPPILWQSAHETYSVESTPRNAGHENNGNKNNACEWFG